MSAPHHEVVVVGAGITGIAMAIALRGAGVRDVLVLDRAEDFGGTWLLNTYPGCACDVPSAMYSYSFAPNPGWTRMFAEQPEILSYVRGVADEKGLRDITRFGIDMESARWDASNRRWDLRTSDGPLTATYLVGCAGPWNEPSVPDIPGLADFPGPVFHSARWDHDADLEGRRVAVIGSGASAVQFVPHLQRRASSVHLFQRTAQWVLPKLDRRVSRPERALLRRVPGAMKGLAGVQYAVMEALGVGFRRPRPLMHGVQLAARLYLWSVVRDRGLRDRLTPSYTVGCKRLLFSNEYLQSLTRVNVEVHATGVRAVRGRTVHGDDGSQVEVDAIALGTGFHILDMPLARKVSNGRGERLADVWEGSPEAYLGTTVATFPNFFIGLGPSLGTGHSSAFAIVEAQAELVAAAVAAARSATSRTVAARGDVQRGYVEEVQRALPRTVYNAGGCSSYYLDDNGRNSFSWPWSTGRLKRRVGTFVAADYTFDEHEETLR